MDGYPVTYERRVRYSDTDLQGIVFNANYFRYFDDAITDYFGVLGLPHGVMIERGHDVVVAHAEADFKSGGTLGEDLIVGVRVSSFGNTSFAIDLRVEEAGGRLVATGQQIYVIVDPTSFRPVEVPDYFKDAVAELQGAPVA